MKKIIQVVLISLILAPSYTTAAREDVIRSSITTKVVEREPVDSLVTVDNVIGTLYMFTEIESKKDQQVTHKWFWNGREVSKQVLNIRAPRTRTWSRKDIPSKLVGSWVVVVYNQKGKEIDRREFEVVLPEQQTVEERVIQNEVSKCARLLEDYDEKYNAQTSDYERFLLHRQRERCEEEKPKLRMKQKQLQQQRSLN